jgi:hypothetical protein
MYSLISAFAGANLVFSVTNYWELFFRPDCRKKALDLGVSFRKYAYDVELQQGKNVVDAAMTTIDVGESGQFTASSDRNRDIDIPLRLSDGTTDSSHLD